jgi:hypothetical protein
MIDELPDQEKHVTPKGAVEVDEEKLDQAAGGTFVDTWGEGKRVKIDFCQTDSALDPTISDAASTEKKI